MHCCVSEPSILGLATCWLCGNCMNIRLHDYKRTCNCKIFCSSRILWSRECWLGGTRAWCHLAINKLISLSLAVERKNLNIISKSRMIFFPYWYFGQERAIRILQNISKVLMQCSQTLHKKKKKRDCTVSLYSDSYSEGIIDLTYRFQYVV